MEIFGRILEADRTKSAVFCVLSPASGGNYVLFPLVEQYIFLWFDSGRNLCDWIRCTLRSGNCSDDQDPENFVIEKPTFLVHDFFGLFALNLNIPAQWECWTADGMLSCCSILCLPAAHQPDWKQAALRFLCNHHQYRHHRSSDELLYFPHADLHQSVFQKFAEKLSGVDCGRTENQHRYHIDCRGVTALFTAAIVFIDLRYSMILLFLLPFLPAAGWGWSLCFSAIPSFKNISSIHTMSSVAR